MKRRSAQLRGNPDATMASARATLQAVYVEAPEGQGRMLRTRQAAEKVWLAASTAADAMTGPVSSGAGVFDAFRRAWGTEGETVARNIEAALHRGCFYSDASACDANYVRGHADKLKVLLNKRPIRDRQIRRRLEQMTQVGR